MKNFIFLALMAVCVLFGCTPSDNADSIYNNHETPKLVVLVYDITASTNAYTILNEQHLTDLFNGMVYDGGGTFISINIQSKSNYQDVLTLQIPQIDTMFLAGNIHQQNRRLVENKNLKAKASTACQKFLTKTQSLIVQEKNEKRSDVITALLLAKNETDLELYKNYKRYVIIVSDLVDNVTRSGSVDFGDSKVILVRPSDNQKIVTANSICVTNSIDEAIRIISL